ncbi:hypothetical protein ACFPRL_13560 [Pseudoclavibacter helvolus]
MPDSRHEESILDLGWLLPARRHRSRRGRRLRTRLASRPELRYRMALGSCARRPVRGIALAGAEHPRRGRAGPAQLVPDSSGGCEDRYVSRGSFRRADASIGSLYVGDGERMLRGHQER